MPPTKQAGLPVGEEKVDCQLHLFVEMNITNLILTIPNKLFTRCM